jgi:hypothetical protein
MQHIARCAVRQAIRDEFAADAPMNSVQLILALPKVDDACATHAHTASLARPCCMLRGAQCAFAA